MIGAPTIKEYVSPVLIDQALLDVQAVLAGGLPWLNAAYGKADRLKVQKNGTTVVFPAVYVEGTEYLRMFPDEHLGNYSFFVIDDPQEVAPRLGVNNGLFNYNFGLIFWFDMRRVFTGAADRWKSYSTENVKSQVLSLLRGGGFNVQLRVFNVFDQQENIYRGFTDREINNQYLMRPYSAFRVEGVIKFDEKSNCNCTYTPFDGVNHMCIEQTFIVS